MSVETELSEMSDSGRFERIATSILRRADPLYESVIQTGINVEGKPIADPVDGFARVEDSDPAHFVLFEYTTTKRSNLESKWLADPGGEGSGSKGDLVKAAEKAKDIQDETPEAEFTVVLVSNRPLGSDLLETVQTTADEFGLSVDTWGVHRLGEFLKTDREGQWIRKHYFGTMEERLSKPLLMELSEDSLDGYEEQLHIRANDTHVQRPELTTILRRAQDPGSESYLIPIVGNSGYGKTVTCYQAMVEWLESGPALHLEPDDLKGAKSLPQALQSVLDRLHPTLDSLAGQDALQIARETERLLLVVDDLNQANDSSILFSRLLSWMGSIQGQDQSDADGLAVTILCPLWPRIWSQQERDAGDSKFVEPVELGPFSSEMATRLIQSHADTHGVDINEKTSQELAERTGRDPHIIGLLGQLLRRDEDIENLPDTSREVLHEYAEYSYETASNASDGPLIVPDYELAVEQLSLKILANREFEPAWRAIRRWMASDSNNLDALRDLTTQAQLLIQLQKQTERLLSFRHDRIRDYLLSKNSFDEISRTGAWPNYLSDPYYHSILGKGIALFRPAGDTLALVRDQAPFALLEALSELGGDSPTYEATLGRAVQQWLGQNEDGSTLLPSELNEAINILSETNSRQVLEITEPLPNYLPVMLTRFRNGDLSAGIQFCEDDMNGSPNTNHPRRNSTFEYAAQQWGDEYTDTLSDYLSSVDSEHVKGALRVAGFLSRPELGDGIKKCWERHGDDHELLPAFVWASFQCCIPRHSPLVDQVLKQWASLPSGGYGDDDTDDELTKGDVFSQLKFSISRNPSQEQIEYLMEAVDECPDLEYHLLNFLNRVPDPDALELVVRKLGEHDQEADGPLPWVMHLTDQWSPERLRGQNLPPEAKARLYDLWVNEEIIDETRTIAFRLWSRNADADDVEELRDASSQDLFEYPAMYWRLKLGDETVFRSPPLDVVENSGLLSAFPSAWCHDAYEIVDAALAQESPDEQGELFHQLGELLFRIPQDDAEQLLDTHWDTVKNQPEFFQGALYTGTTRTKALAEKSYKTSESPSKLLNHIGMNFGFNTRGRSELITQEHLFSLEPYLSELGDLRLIEIGEKANEIGLRDWGVEHIQPLLSEEKRKQSYPTDDDLIERLDEIEEGEDVIRDIRVWMSDFERRGESNARAFDILKQWFTDDVSIDGFQMVAAAIKRWGTREELSILDTVSLDDDRIHHYEDTEFGVKVRTLS